jgi:hypothetical protein
MFNIRLKKLFIFLFLITSLSLNYGCSNLSALYGKPSGGEMKSIIFNLTKNAGRNIVHVSFRELKITKDFTIKKNGEEWYCIEVNYWYEYDYKGISSDGRPADRTEHFSYIKAKDQFSFTKREDKWHGQKGWVN